MPDNIEYIEPYIEVGFFEGLRDASLFVLLILCSVAVYCHLFILIKSSLT